MPSFDQLTELRENCTWTWTTRNGVNGYEVVGPNGNSIFLPVAGYRFDTSLRSADLEGYYWLRTLCTDDPSCAYLLAFASLGIDWGVYYYRYVGLPVRPVRNK